MDYSKPTLLIISGPNGAGKSTNIRAMLPAEFDDINSFDRDKTRTEFAKQLADERINSKDIPSRSTRMMEERLVQEMKQAIKLRSHFVLETPLSHPDYWRYIDLFETINEYFKTFTVIELYDGMNVPALLVRMENNKVTDAVSNALKKNWIKKGLPSIAQIIKTYHRS